MNAQGSVSSAHRGLAVAVPAALTSGVMVGLGDIASLPTWIVLVAASVFVASISVFGVITYRDARCSGGNFSHALARSFRAAGKVLVALMP
jgi:hypothetical protein